MPFYCKQWKGRSFSRCFSKSPRFAHPNTYFALQDFSVIEPCRRKITFFMCCMPQPKAFIYLSVLTQIIFRRGVEKVRQDNNLESSHNLPRTNRRWDTYTTEAYCLLSFCCHVLYLKDNARTRGRSSASLLVVGIPVPCISFYSNRFLPVTVGCTKPCPSIARRSSKCYGNILYG